MRISHVKINNTYRPSFGAIQYAAFNPEFNANKDELTDEITRFSTKKDNATYLGHGLFAGAYALNSFPNIVIKYPYSNSEALSQEAYNLSLLPDDIGGTQRLVAEAYDDADGQHYLLSTKVDGESSRHDGIKWTRKHMQNLFNVMFDMDKNGIYHGDLNNGNIKLTKDGEVNLLDFQFAHKVEKQNFFDENDASILPGFIFMENAQMFEQAAIPRYIKTIGSEDKAKSFLQMYLSEKADYHKKRAEFIEQEEENLRNDHNEREIEEAKAFEAAQAKMLKKPSENVLKLEAKRIQFLSAFREAYGKIDPNVQDKNIIPAGTSYLVTLSYIQDFRREVAAQKNNILSTDMLEYLNGLEKYGDFWFEKIKSWAPNAFYYPLRHTFGNYESWEGQLFDFKNPKVDAADFGAVTNILSLIDNSYTPKYTKGFSIDTESIANCAQVCDRYITTLLEAYNNNEDVTKAARKVEQVQRRLENALKSGWGMDVLNLSLLGILRAREVEEKVSETDSFVSDYIATVPDNLKRMYEKLAVECFNGMYDDIISDSPDSGKLCGYKNMQNFEN